MLAYNAAASARGVPAKPDKAGKGTRRKGFSGKKGIGTEGVVVAGEVGSIKHAKLAQW